MTPEKRLMNEIRIECGRRGWIVIRHNVGRFLLINGQYLDTGLPKGFPDMQVLTDDGRSIFVETKIKPRKLSPEQVAMHELLKTKKHVVIVCYSIKDFLKNT